MNQSLRVLAGALVGTIGLGVALLLPKIISHKCP